MFEKNEPFLTGEEAEKIRRTRIVVIGAGALGQSVVPVLVRGGVERLTLVDGDVVSESDFNRQLYADILTLGRPKTDVLCERMGEISPRLKIEQYNCRFQRDNSTEILQEADLVLDCVDNIPTRLCLEEAAEKRNIPLVHAAVEGWFGQVGTVFPGDRTLSLLFARQEEQRDTAVMPAVTAAAAFQAAEALRIAAGKTALLRGKLLCIDMLSGETEQIILPADRGM